MRRTMLAYGGAALGVAIAHFLPLLVPDAAGWAPTAGIVVGLLIIFSADNEGGTTEGAAATAAKKDE
eukprot:jgi/Tetstr1/449693/TSEL_036761.t1